MATVTVANDSQPITGPENGYSNCSQRQSTYYRSRVATVTVVNDSQPITGPEVATVTVVNDSQPITGPEWLQ